MSSSSTSVDVPDHVSQRQRGFLGFVERVGNSSVTIGHRIIGTGTEAPLYCDGNVVLVWIDRHSGRPIPLPEAIRAAAGA